MTDFNKGDRVTYSGELEVTHNAEENDRTVMVKVPTGSTQFGVWRKDVTKVKPALPTAFGSVVEVDGVKWLRDPYGWGTASDARATQGAMAELNYTILRDGI